MNDPGPSSAYYRRFAATADGPVRAPSPPSSPLLSPRQTPTEFLDAAANEGLYAILNLPRDASLAEIKDQYRTLAAIYHPDKQPDEARRRAAHKRFTALQRAHEILTDPGKRAIYDLMGEEGLRTSWEVGPRNMSPQQLRTHFARQSDLKRKLDAEALVNSKGDMSIVLDARGVFLSRDLFDDPEGLVSHTPLARLARVSPGQILLTHSFETPIDDATQFVVEGTMAARGGAGGANVTGTIRHQFSPHLWIQCSQAFLNPFVSAAKATYTFDENTYLTGHAVSQTWLAPPRFSATLGRRLWPETTGFITYKTGFWTLGTWGVSLPRGLRMADQSALSVGLTTARLNGTGWTCEVSAGRTIPENSLSVDWSTRVLGLRLKFGFGTDILGGWNTFADAAGKVTENTRAGAALELGVQGVTFKLYVSRIGQKISVPILLAPDLNPYVVAGAVVIPTAGWAALYHFYIEPRKHRKIHDRIIELRREHADYISAKRSEAADAVLLMGRSVSAKAASERERDGLVILSAQYGLASAFTPRGIRAAREDGVDDVVDVTIPVQGLVQNSRLFIPAGRNKFNLLGFYDPCIGENKRLRVRYLFRGKVHEVTVDDVSMLRAPVKSHALDE